MTLLETQPIYHQRQAFNIEHPLFPYRNLNNLHIDTEKLFQDVFKL